MNYESMCSKITRVVSRNRKMDAMLKEIDMSIAKLDVWAETVVHCLMEQKKREAHCQEKCADTYGTMVDTATKKLVDNVRKFAKHWA